MPDPDAKSAKPVPAKSVTPAPPVFGGSYVDGKLIERTQDAPPAGPEE